MATVGRATWDIACRVVDNLGDVGIGWRLARQLAARGMQVRLAVDGLSSLARIEPRVDPGADVQHVAGVRIVPWTTLAAVGVEAADTVIELLGCGLPDVYLDAMDQRRRPAVWIDFEHLSAQSWVERFHGLPSPHPVRPLLKHFFYPGFGVATGGLLVDGAPEIAARSAPPPPPAMGAPADGRTVSVFAYPHAPVGVLLDVLASGRFGHWTALLFGDLPASHATSESLRVVAAPFVDQDGYDDVLARCDLNFVRGEDSFVRAQWAGRPLVWQAYRQQDDAHRPKIAAFEASYGDGLPSDMREVVQRALATWNGPGGSDDDGSTALGDFVAALPILTPHAARWRSELATRTPLVDRLIAFVATRRFRDRGTVC